jgi:hypothetical protein
MFGTNDSRTVLPKETQSALEKLKAQAAELVAKALTREPKLTADEKAKIATLEARKAYLAPVNDRLSKLLEEKEARLKFFDRNIQTLLIEGGDLDALVSEYIPLKPACQVLSETYRTTLFETSQAAGAIEDLKEKARQREIHQEVK